MSKENKSRNSDSKDSSQESLGTASQDIADRPPSADIRDLFDDAFDDADRTSSTTHALMMRLQKYRGPLPQAEEFRLYEQACPGAGSRILDYMDREQSHRHAMDDRTLTALAQETVRGQWLGFAVMVCLIGVSLVIALTGQPILGGIVMLMTAAFGVVHKFIDGRTFGDKPEPSEPKGRSMPPSDAPLPRGPRR